MKILSLFDGMSCGHIALLRAGITVDEYYSSEIDKYCIKITQNNFPDTIQLGSVTELKTENLPTIDLLIGGSPCQGFSFAGKQLNFNDPRSKLFFEFVRVLKELRLKNPDIKFLLENVKMKKEFEDIITACLGVEPIEINSSLVSGQNRKRLYWTNIEGVTQPTDKAITLESILLPLQSLDKKLQLSEKEKAYMNRKVKGGRTHWNFDHHSDTANKSSSCLVANLYKGVPYNVLIDRRTGNKPLIRKFSPVEAERLQTVPDNYTAGVSNTQRYKMLGNGWNVNTITHIFQHLAA